jgi:hypothetical protein
MKITLAVIGSLFILGSKSFADPYHAVSIGAVFVYESNAGKLTTETQDNTIIITKDYTISPPFSQYDIVRDDLTGEVDLIYKPTDSKEAILIPAPTSTGSAQNAAATKRYESATFSSFLDSPYVGTLESNLNYDIHGNFLSGSITMNGGYAGVLRGVIVIRPRKYNF